MRSTAVHVQAAKQLLAQLEDQAETALDALGREQSTEFFAAVDARDRLLNELDGVINAMVRDRSVAATAGIVDPDAQALFDDVARAAAAALESHEQLVVRTRGERDRLRGALQRVDRPDAVADQYSAVARRGAHRTISVTG
jgi:hypothetical protein